MSRILPSGTLSRTPLARMIAPVLAIILAAALALPAQAECYVDYKVKQGNPPHFAYGVSQVSGAACGNKGAERSELEPRLASDGWTLLKILSSFGPEGLNERKASAGDLFLRY